MQTKSTFWVGKTEFLLKAILSFEGRHETTTTHVEMEVVQGMNRLLQRTRGKKKKETKETKEMSSCTKPLSAPWLLAARLRAGLRQLGMHVPGAIG